MIATNLFQAAELRERAFAQLKNNAGEFTLRALAALRDFPDGFETTGEQIRILLDRRGIRPHHHNAWGALINQAVKQGLLEWTGRMSNMSTIKSHARKTPVYRVHHRKSA